MNDLKFKKYRLFFIGLSVFLLTSSTQAQTNFDIVPEPSNIMVLKGVFTIPNAPTVYLDKEYEQIKELLTEYPGISSVRNGTIKDAVIKIQKGKIQSQKEGAYELVVNEKGIGIKANDRAGIINGVFTFIQIGLLQDNPGKIDFVRINDEPRFGYRGLHLDPSRHFLPVSFVKKFIDLMAIYHFNNLHLHLTDSDGWRIEIKRYPELTKTAAWRNSWKGEFWQTDFAIMLGEGDPNVSGGFYSQDDAKEIVRYAALRGINVIPEIEMPGHSREVFTAYPELTCSGKSYESAVYCVGNPETFKFLKNVLDEIMDIFPAKYLHIGGDEVDTSSWEHCSSCQKLMKDSGYTSLDQLQSYLIKHIAAYVHSKGRRIIGWDEILKGGIAQDATVMSWRGEEGGIKAAKMKHDVIMTPMESLYISTYQSNPLHQPRAGLGYLPIEKVYAYDPIPNEITKDEQKYILGAQACLWGERLTTTNMVEYMAFPRALALSEVVWSAKKDRNYADFQRRLFSQYSLLQKLQVNYYRPATNVNATMAYQSENRSVQISLSSERTYRAEIHYTIDGSEPTINAPIYGTPITATQSLVLKAANFINGQKVSPTLVQPVDIHKAIGKKVIYNSKWDNAYQGKKETTLTDGDFGSFFYNGDNNWLGFRDSMDITVDLGKMDEVRYVGMSFKQLVNRMKAYMPAEMEVYTSDDNVTFTKIGIVKNNVPDDIYTELNRRLEFELAHPVKTRYLRVKTKPRQGTLQLADEVIVY